MSVIDFKTKKGETQSFPLGYEVKDLQCVYLYIGYLYVS